MLAPAASAFDGRASVWGNWQSGGAGAGEYSSRTLLEDYRLGQQYAPARGLQIFGDLNVQRRDLESTTLGITSDSFTETLQPSVGLSYRTHILRAGLNGLATRRDSWDFAGDSTRDERVNVSGWLRADAGWSALEFRAQEDASWRHSGGAYRESREHDQTVRLEVKPTAADELQYRFDRQDQTSATFERDYEQITNELTLRSHRRFAAGRGRFDLYARGARTRQTTTRTGAVPLVLVAPLLAAVSLDDTPEFLDPLEPAPVSEPGLFDRDLDAPTSVNIGDSASVVRQYGGDYRNLAFDFSEVEEFSRIVLYVDRVIRFPQLFLWQVRVSDDPEGRDWSEELSPALVTTEYFELEDGRQGWTFTLAEPVRHRRVKLVDSKLGATEVDIFVTEMEVLQPVESTDARQVVERLTRYRLRGDLAFDVTDGLELSYGLEPRRPLLRRRRPQHRRTGPSLRPQPAAGPLVARGEPPDQPGAPRLAGRH
ncbi:MAG: hypothetical protein R3D98_06720 [Candidatus Krumholzibacteriia bacterium]